MNSVVLIGRLVRDPELRHTPSGDPVCEFRIAVDRAGDKNDDGYGSGFFDVSAWARQAELSAQYLTKGSLVAVAGSLRFHEWEDKDTGKKRSKIDVRAGQVQFLTPKGEGRTAAASSVDNPPSADDDIPF